MGGKISALPDLKNQMVMLDIEMSWGKGIINSEQEKPPISGVVQVWSKGGDKLSYPDSTHIYPEITSQTSHSPFVQRKSPHHKLLITRNL